MLDCAGGRAGVKPVCGMTMVSREAPLVAGAKNRSNICGVTTMFVSIIGPISGTTGSGAGFTGGSVMRVPAVDNSFVPESTGMSGINSTGASVLLMGSGRSAAAVVVTRANRIATGPTDGRYHGDPAREPTASIKAMKMNPFVRISRELPCPQIIIHLCIGGLG